MTDCCPIGRRHDAAEIDAALHRLGELGAESLGALAERTGAAKSSLHRHLKGCLERVPGQLGTPEERPGTGAGTSRSPFRVPNPGDDSSTTPRKLVTALIEERCIDLRTEGKTWAAIGRELGIDDETAMDAFERVCVRTQGRADRKVEVARELEVRRCEAIIAAQWATATDTGEAADPDVRGRAADRVLRASERKAKLLGLDAGTGMALPFYLAPGFDEFLGVLLAPLERDHPEALAAAMDAARDHIAMIAATKLARPGLRLVSGGRSA